MKYRKAIITGGAGFIGSFMVKRLLAEGFEVLNIDKLTYASNLKNIESIQSHKNYQFVQCDICDSSEISNIFSTFKPDIIIHFAAESHVDRSIIGSQEFIQTNILGTYNLLEVSRKYIQDHNKFTFYHVSTDEVYGDLGPKDNPFTENHVYAPSSPYSSSKASSDHLVRSWGRTFGLKYLISNCSNNYGPCQNNEKLIPKTITNALNGIEIPIYGSGLQIRDWLYVEDHIDAIYKIMNSSRINETFNIGGNNEITNIKVVEQICKYLDKRKPNILDKLFLKSFTELITYVADRPGHDQRYAIDSSKLNNLLAWFPSETFKTGIHKTVDWYLENEEFFK